MYRITLAIYYSHTIFILEVENVGVRIRLFLFHVSPLVRIRAFGPFGRNSGSGY